MTVLRPSLPPVSWTTTRTVSLAPGLSAGGAARAVRPRNAGTLAPNPSSDDWRRKARRVVIGRVSGGGTPQAASVQLELGQGQHQMRDGAHAVVRPIVRRPVDRVLGRLCLLEVVEQA